jgi:hypothetical protein
MQRPSVDYNIETTGKPECARREFTRNVGVGGDEFMTKAFLSTCAVRMIVSGTIGFGYDIVALGDNE